MLVFGEVSYINPKNYTVKLKLKEYDNFETPWLFVPQMWVKKNKSGYLPELNSIVPAILNDDMTEGIIIGALYNDEDVVLTEFENKNFIRFSDGTTIVHSENSLELIAQTVIIDGDLRCTGDIEDKKGTMQDIRNTYNSHDHPNGNNGTSTGAPTEKM